GNLADVAGLCADVKDGIKNGKFAGEVVQTWQCYEGNRNQQWEIVDMSLPPREVKERGVEVEERGVEVEQR
ncbi:RICIN domain-containing protein, partial [Enterobacter hormaechei]|nr:RICIN domain-containing protein [Enterobacter hormaechei]